MTDFMTVNVQREQRSTGARFQSTCFLCRNSLQAQVWLHLFVLGFLRLSACAASVPSTREVQICIQTLRPAIQKSDAMLYAPSADDVKKDCRSMSLRCYMLELLMVINEEEIMDHNADCISDFHEFLPTDTSGDCPPCEVYSLENITVFFERLHSLLEEVNEMQNM